MRLFEKDSKRPGRPILHAGIMACALTGVFGLAWLANHSSRAMDMLGILLFAPIFFTLLMVIMVPWLIVQGLFIGAPSVSIIYALSAMRRNWRGIAGTVLLASASVAAAYAVVKIW